jgi:hypothetical protein
MHENSLGAEASSSILCIERRGKVRGFLGLKSGTRGIYSCVEKMALDEKV